MDMPNAPQKLDLRTIAWIAYSCWAAGILTHALQIFGVLPLVGLIIAALKRKDAVGTIYESHFTWIIRTFIFGLIGALIAAVLMLIPSLGMLAIVALGLWGLYRLVKGGLRLMENKPVENPTAII